MTSSASTASATRTASAASTASVASAARTSVPRSARRALKLFSTLSEHLICHESSTKAHECSTKNHERSTMQKQLLLLGFNALPKNILIFPTFPKRFTLPTFPRHPKKFTQRSPSRMLTAVADSHRRFL